MQRPTEEELEESIKELIEYKNRLEKEVVTISNKLKMPQQKIHSIINSHSELNQIKTILSKLKKQKENGVVKKLVGIELIEKGIARKGYSILDEKGNRVGRITSGTMSPTLKKPIAMGYVHSSITVDGS